MRSFGFYSALHAQSIGTKIWETVLGEQVQTTAVFDSQEQGEQEYDWPDRQFLGELIGFICQGFDPVSEESLATIISRTAA
jgi:hypothetical protein